MYLHLRFRALLRSFRPRLEGLRLEISEFLWRNRIPPFRYPPLYLPEFAILWTSFSLGGHLDYIRNSKCNTVRCAILADYKIVRWNIFLVIIFVIITIVNPEHAKEFAL